MDEDDKPVFGSSKSSSTSFFVMGPAELVTVKNDDDDGSGDVSEISYFNRHSYAEIYLDTSKSDGKMIKEYWVYEYPVAEDDESSGANPTLCQLDAAKKNVMLVVNGQSFSDFIGKAIFAKPISKASFTGSAASVYPIWYSKSLSAKYSGISTTDPDPDYVSSNKFFYGRNYTIQTTAKLNTRLTALVYYKNYLEALAAVIEDLESKGYAEGNYE